MSSRSPAPGTHLPRAAQRRTRSAALALAAVASLAGQACRSSPEPPPAADYPPVESSSFGSMQNVSATGEIWFGGRPSPEDLDLAKRRGVTTVIDLTTPEEAAGIDAEEISRSLGLEYLHPGVPGGRAPSDALVDEVLAALELHASEPTLLFCGSGGRCAAFLAIFRAVRLGVPIDATVIEARRAGMRPSDEAFVRAQVGRLTGAGYRAG